MALGAGGRDVAWTVLASALKLVGGGLLAGVAGALAVGGVVSEIVAGVSGTDPATYLVVASLVLVIGAIAALVPARRAAAIDPMQALHWE
jgi:ABC-type antimicrobial peptide transport system permease subunit